MSRQLLDIMPQQQLVSLPTGVKVLYFSATAPSGWITLTGSSAIRTLGDSSSGADRANADTESLFSLIWNNMADAQAPVSSGRGANAAADFAAHKTITIPDPRGRAIIGTGQGSGLTDRANGATGGAETHQLTTAELAAHTHTDRSVSGFGTDVASGSSYGITTSNNTGSTGSDSAHNNMQPWVADHIICKL